MSFFEDLSAYDCLPMLRERISLMDRWSLGSSMCCGPNVERST